MRFRRLCALPAALFIASCGGGETSVVPTPAPKTVCRVSVSPSSVKVTTTVGSSFTVTSTDCGRVEVSGPMFSTPLTVSTSGTVDVPPGGPGGYVRAKGIATNGSGNADSVLVFFLRPVGMQLIRDSFPSSAPANSTVHYRLIRSFLTSCGHVWITPLFAGMESGTILPNIRLNAQDTTQVDITLPSFVLAEPLMFGPQCVGEDDSRVADTLSIVATYPAISTIDSIVPRVITADSTTDYRVFAHGCPFTSAIGVRGFPGARDGTVFLPAPFSVKPTPVIDSTFPRTTFVNCNVVGFRWTWQGAKSGTPMFFYVGNPGTPMTELRVTLK